MDGHKGTRHAGLQPSLEPAAEAFDALDGVFMYIVREIRTIKMCHHGTAAR